MKVLSLLLVLLLAMAITLAEARQSRKFIKLSDQKSMEHLMRGAEDSLMPLLRKIECRDGYCNGIRRRCLNKRENRKKLGKRGKWERCIRTIVKCLANLKRCHDSKLDTLEHKLEASVSSLNGICEMFCLNGTCNYEFKCDCEEGFEGFACNIGICDPECINGHCDDGKCYCDDGNECINGICEDGKCKCNSGYEGNDCGTVISSSEVFLCGNYFKISTTDVCNGNDDCSDNSDEESCGYKAYPDMFWSADQQCGEIVGTLGGNNTEACMEKCIGRYDCTAFIYTEYYGTCYFYNCPLPIQEPTETGGGFLAYGFVPDACSSDQFLCTSGKCISNEIVCDFNNDCSDNLDEESCGACSSDQFICASGKCISNETVCDFNDDCGDFTDEESCGYKAYPGKYWSAEQCGNHVYLDFHDSNTLQGCMDSCKAWANCSAFKWEELNTGCWLYNKCPLLVPEPSEIYDGYVSYAIAPGACSSDQFICTSGKCISNETGCDFNDDCGDFSDEESCGYKIYPGKYWSNEECGDTVHSDYSDSNTIQGCMDSCKAWANCSAFNWEKTGGSCFLYDKCPLLVPEPTQMSDYFDGYAIVPGNICAIEGHSKCTRNPGMFCRDKCNEDELNYSAQYGATYACNTGGCHCCYGGL